MLPRTCVSPNGHFVYGIHRPRFKVRNLRKTTRISTLGTLSNGEPVDNRNNFPTKDVEVDRADRVYEIPNAFPFKGTTFISSTFADLTAKDPNIIELPERPPVSLGESIENWDGNFEMTEQRRLDLFRCLPEPLLLALAATSTDPGELKTLAEMACRFIYPENDKDKPPTGMTYTENDQNGHQPDIDNYPLFKTLANNPFLPDVYRDIMVLKPGAQGDSEIVGEWSNREGSSHVYEYFRRNSYIPWGHYAANMADDCTRYAIEDLTSSDMVGMRHLYYQRTYVRLADLLSIGVPSNNRLKNPGELEKLRLKILSIAISDSGEKKPSLQSNTLGLEFRVRLHPNRLPLTWFPPTDPPAVCADSGTRNHYRPPEANLHLCSRGSCCPVY